MNRENRSTAKRETYRLRVPASVKQTRDSPIQVDPDDVAPWVISQARAWPLSAEDRLVAARMGVQIRHVQLARGQRTVAA